MTRFLLVDVPCGCTVLVRVDDLGHVTPLIPALPRALAEVVLDAVLAAVDASPEEADGGDDLPVVQHSARCARRVCFCS